MRAGGARTNPPNDAERPEKVEGAGMIWLPDMDLNHDKQIQSLLCYRYTIGQTGAGDNLVSPHPESSGQAPAPWGGREPASVQLQPGGGFQPSVNVLQLAWAAGRADLFETCLPRSTLRLVLRTQSRSESFAWAAPSFDNRSMDLGARPIPGRPVGAGC